MDARGAGSATRGKRARLQTRQFVSALEHLHVEDSLEVVAAERRVTERAERVFPAPQLSGASPAH